MSYQAGPGLPMWTMEIEAFEKHVAEFFATRVPQINTAEQKDAFIDNASQAVLKEMIKVLFKSMTPRPGI
jgi:hypothetical protein